MYTTPQKNHVLNIILQIFYKTFHNHILKNQHLNLEKIDWFMKEQYTVARVVFFGDAIQLN